MESSPALMAVKNVFIAVVWGSCALTAVFGREYQDWEYVHTCLCWFGSEHEVNFGFHKLRDPCQESQKPTAPAPAPAFAIECSSHPPPRSFH